MNMLDWLQSIFEHSAVARIFLVIALGYLLGELKFPGNFRLGIAAVLFVGLALGAWKPALKVPDEIQVIGLVLFVYCVGLHAAPGFFQCLRRDGIRVNLAVLAAMLYAFAATWAAVQWSGRSLEVLAGSFCGALTNTPALGAVTEMIGHGAGGQEIANQAVVGYGIVYPFAVIAVLLLFQFRLSRGSPPTEELVTAGRLPRAQTIEIKTLDRHDQPWRANDILERTRIILTRWRTPDGRVRLVENDTPFPIGSWVVAVGSAEQLEAATKLLGVVAPEPLEASLGDFAANRYFVSNHAVAGRKLGELAPELEKIGAVVSRLRRGDIDLTVGDDTILHLGDRIKVVTYKEKEPEVRKFFGNSLQVLTEGGYLSFAVGITLGLLLGQIPISVPGFSQPLRLGAAGGPLLVALVLGSVGRTGPFVWNLPFSTNLTLRQLGILMFLATAGVKAGAGLLTTLRHDGLFLILFGIFLTLSSHAILWLLLQRGKKSDVTEMFGVSSGFQTQPAALVFAAARVPQGPLNLAYATAYPLAMILKIILIQLLILIS